jgi:hypothetical protein
MYMTSENRLAFRLNGFALSLKHSNSNTGCMGIYPYCMMCAGYNGVVGKNPSVTYRAGLVYICKDTFTKDTSWCALSKQRF